MDEQAYKNNVSHPKHYCIEGRRECIEELEQDYGETVARIFCLTNAYKYLYRCGLKDGNSQEQDIEKAKWYYNKANEYHNCDYVFGVMDLRYKIKTLLNEYGVLEAEDGKL